MMLEYRPIPPPSQALSEEEKAILRVQIAAARVLVVIDKKHKRASDPEIAALAARKKPY
ncbi:hypothetical protein ACEXQE_00545 [Herbiconiux sp. P17]|uniref:hypothetical protein n=1 Tax=Herbiconiux wuyangfengii TaxID=3342794 RepID=UPI0035B7F351